MCINRIELELVIIPTGRMSDIMLPKHIQDLLNQICVENNFRNYTTELKQGSNAGDGFTSELLSVKIFDRESKQILNVVCKLAPLNKNRQKQFFSNIIFDREITFYQKVAPCFAKFQKEKKLPEEDQFLAYPKCYGALSDHENFVFAVVLEDLRPKGFKLWNKMEPVPIENAHLVMRELGKLHGISIAMKHQRPEVFAEFAKLNDMSTRFFQTGNMKAMFEASFDRAITTLRCEDYKNIMRDIKVNMISYLDSCVNVKASERFGVISHGDCWNNNYLYKFNENGIAENIRFLDWQIMRYTSPALDIVYNIFTSTDKAFRKAEYDNLLNIYYKSLSKTVKLLGSNPDELFTFNDLQSELKAHGKFALIVAPIVIQVSHADSSELSNLDEMCDKVAAGENSQELITGLTEEAMLKCGQRIHDVIEDILTLGYYKKN